MEGQQEMPQDFYYPPSSMPKTDSKADLLDKIKPELAVEVIKQTLMGNEYSDQEGKWIPNRILRGEVLENGKWVKKTESYALSEFGAMKIASLVYPACSQNASLSNLKEEKINRRVLNIIKALCKMMLDYHDRMPIESVAQLYHIKEIVYTLVWVSLTQSEHEGIRRLINSTISESRNVSTYGEEKGLFSGLFRQKVR
jgi:hypothetical protein